MTTMVNNKKPSTPLMEFYSLGVYRKSVKEYDTGIKHQAMPSVAARIKERNQLEINIKPSVHDRFNSKFYKPFYMDPFGYKNKTTTNQQAPVRRSFVSNNDKSPDVQVNATNRAKFIYRPA